jgi:hypothetical protein
MFLEVLLDRVLVCKAMNASSECMLGIWLIGWCCVAIANGFIYQSLYQPARDGLEPSSYPRYKATITDTSYVLLHSVGDYPLSSTIDVEV